VQTIGRPYAESLTATTRPKKHKDCDNDYNLNCGLVSYKLFATAVTDLQLRYMTIGYYVFLLDRESRRLGTSFGAAQRGYAITLSNGLLSMILYCSLDTLSVLSSSW